MAELIRREYAERYIEKYEKSKASGDIMAQITCCSKLACIFSRICNTKHNSKLFCTKEFDKRLQELLSYDAVFSSLELARIHLLRTEKSLREGAAEEAAGLRPHTCQKISVLFRR